jgi:hypothetical protein
MPESLMRAAHKPLERMLEMSAPTA